MKSTKIKNQHNSALSDEALEALNKVAQSGIEGMIWPEADVSTSVAHEPIDLSVEKMMSMVRETQREFFVYVIASPEGLIPENAYGILWLREKDAKNWKKK